MPAAHRRTRRAHAAPRSRRPWRATVALSATAAVLATASLSAASAAPTGQTTTTSGQSFSIAITSPADGASLPVGTTSAPVTGTISIGNVPVTGEAHVVFVIDESGSLGATNFNTEKQSAIGLFNQIRNTSGLSVNTSLIFFASGVTTVLNDQPAADNFVNAVNNRAYAAGGATFTKDAMTAAQTQLSGKNGIKQVILLTDGAPNPASTQTPTQQQRNVFDAEGAAVYVYSVGSQGVCAPLQVIATKCTLVPTFTSLPSTLTGTPPAGISGAALSVNGGGYTPVTSINSLGQISATASGLQAGDNTITLRGTATDGTNVTADVTVHVAVPDTTPPDTAIDSGPSGTVTSGSAAFTYSGTPASDTDHFTCALDGSSVPCANDGKSFTALGDGSHTFTVAAVDAAGNVDQTPASRTWSVDTTAPNTSIDSGPSGTVTSGSAAFTYSGSPASDTDHFVCTLDGSSVACANDGKSFAGLSDGSHTFTVAAVDGVGNTDATPASRTWTVDTTAPGTTIDSGPSGTVASGSAAFTYSGTPASDTDHFVCTLDGSSVACANDGKSFPALGDGSHTFTVAAVDAAGNVDQTPASRTWSIDTAAPDTSIDSGPSGTVASGAAAFTYSGTPASDTDHFVCTLDGSSVPCANDGKSFPALGDGSHTFTVAAVDAVGNADSTPASRTWTVDTTAPDTVIDSGPSGTVASSTAAFTYSGTPVSDTDHFSCTLDGSSVPCANDGKSLSGLSDGSHTFTVAAVDAVGNVDQTPASRTWTVDTTAPDTSIDSGPSGTIASGSAAFTYSGTPVSDTDHFVCTLDGSSVPCANDAKSFSGLADGSHTFTVAAVDAVGNADNTPASRTWTVDTTAPDTSIDSGPSGTVASGSAAFTYSGTPASDTDHFVCTLDGSAVACANDGRSFSGLADGSHTFTVTAVDAVGNTDATPASRTWTVDTTAPDTSIDSGPSGTVASGSATFTYSGHPASDTNAFVCTLDGMASVCPNGTVTLTGLGVGSHTFTVAAVDAVGNVDLTPASRTWVVDAPPVAALGASPSTVETAQAVTFSTAGTSDPDGASDLASWTLSYGDGSPAASGTGAPPASLTHAYATAGAYTAKLTVTDRTGLSSSATANVTVNRSATTLVAAPDIATVKASALLTTSGLWALLTGNVTLHPAATLTRTRDGSPVVGRTVTFKTSSGTPICSATTDATGKAACGGVLTVIPITLGGSYQAGFAGDTAYAPSTATGSLALVVITVN